MTGWMTPGARPGNSIILFFLPGKVEKSKILAFRLLDAAETLVTLQTSDLGASNNPLFGSNNQVNHQQSVTFLITYIHNYFDLDAAGEWVRGRASSGGQLWERRGRVTSSGI